MKLLAWLQARLFQPPLPAPEHAVLVPVAGAGLPSRPVRVLGLLAAP